MSRELRIGVVAAALVAGVGWLDGAEEPQQIDPQAAAVLRAAGEYLQQLKSFGCECTGTHKYTLRGKPRERTDEYSITLQRPNRASVLLKGEIGANIVSDGKQVFTFIPRMKKYIERTAPQDLGELYPSETTTFLNQVGGVFVPSLLAADPAKTLLDGVNAGKHLGEEEIEGVRCHRLRFFQDNMDWDVWIETGDRPLIRKLTQDMSKRLAQDGQSETARDEKTEITLALRQWKPNLEVAAETFQFQPPIHTRRVESFLAKPVPPLETEGLTLSWSVPGAWTMAAAAGDLAVAFDARGEGIRVDALGKKQQEFKIAAQAGVLRIANLSPKQEPSLVASSLLEPSVDAYAHPRQTALWSYRCGQGSDVWAFDLDGDKLDEVVIGSHTGPGLQVLDSQGKLLWKNLEIGNVWRVSAGDVLGDDQPEVLATSSAGRVEVFDRNGTKLKEIDPGFYAIWVRVAQPPRGKKGTLIVGGIDPQGEGMLVALEADGECRWSWWLSLDDQINSVQNARSRPWIAVGQRGGTVLVVQLADGKVIARIPGQGHLPQLDWLERPGQAPLLLVATGRDLNALVVQEPK